MSKIRKAGALIFRNKKFLIVKPCGKPYFINPGGKYEQNETAKDCLRRELREELNISVNSCRFYGRYEIDEAAHSKLPLSLELYIVSIKGDPSPSSEIERIEWMSKEDFEKGNYNLAPSFSQYVPDLIKDGLL